MTRMSDKTLFFILAVSLVLLLCAIGFAVYVLVF